MSNLVRKTLRFNQSITVPAGVRFMTAKGIKRASNIQFTKNNHGSQQNLLFIDAVGNAFSAGLGTSGVLGDSTLVKKSSPVLVTGGLQFKQISQGFSNLCGIDYNNDAYSWGLQTNGEHGIGTVAVRSSPTLVVGGIKWTSIGSYNGSALSNFTGINEAGTMYSCGLNANGQVGDNSVTKRSSPVLVSGGLTWMPDPKGFGSSGDGNTWGITTANDAYIWGLNTSGQIGDGTSVPKSSPTLVIGSLKFQMLCQASGTASTFVGLTTSGTAYAWGNNNNGQIGDGSVTLRSSPVLVSGGLTNIIDVQTANNGTAGTSFAFLTLAGDLYTVGRNNSGQLGVGNTTDRSSPTLVVGGLKWSKVLGGSTNAGASCFFVGLTTGGDIYTWGANTVGNLGDNSVVPKSSPVLVSGGLKFANFQLDRTVGGVHAISTDGKIYSWGGNADGQMADGTSAAKSSPTLVVGGFSPICSDIVSETTIGPLTPGGTLALKKDQLNAFLGPYAIGTGPFDEVIVEYFS